MSESYTKFVAGLINKAYDHFIIKFKLHYLKFMKNMTPGDYLLYLRYIIDESKILHLIIKNYNSNYEYFKDIDNKVDLFMNLFPIKDIIDDIETYIMSDECDEILTKKISKDTVEKLLRNTLTYKSFKTLLKINKYKIIINECLENNFNDINPAIINEIFLHLDLVKKMELNFIGMITSPEIWNFILVHVIYVHNIRYRQYQFNRLITNLYYRLFDIQRNRKLIEKNIFEQFRENNISEINYIVDKNIDNENLDKLQRIYLFVDHIVNEICYHMYIFYVERIKIEQNDEDEEYEKSIADIKNIIERHQSFSSGIRLIIADNYMNIIHAENKDGSSSASKNESDSNYLLSKKQMLTCDDHSFETYKERESLFEKQLNDHPINDSEMPADDYNFSVHKNWLNLILDEQNISDLKNKNGSEILPNNISIFGNEYDEFYNGCSAIKCMMDLHIIYNCLKFLKHVIRYKIFDEMSTYNYIYKENLNGKLNRVIENVFTYLINTDREVTYYINTIVDISKVIDVHIFN